ncbi:hypothetical protein [Novosphingobium sp.]|uniref:hypothetical protein n=1 Tax=Novosphingobium sp. TaxID=1874826 RepID=UPI003445571A
MSEWNAWIGRVEQRHDRVDEGLLARWLATFDRPAPADGTVPQGFHWCLCTPDAATARLGPDGHPLRDDSPDSFLPPDAPLSPRRRGKARSTLPRGMPTTWSCQPSRCCSAIPR